MNILLKLTSLLFGPQIKILVTRKNGSRKTDSIPSFIIFKPQNDKCEETLKIF